jgi:YVTN family beta-propeller protein
MKKRWRAGAPILPRAGYHILLALVVAPMLALALVAAGGMPSARADGGAPNLVYVSGTKDGVSVVDIANQQVSGTIHVDGDPRGMTLSADSRFLYVAVPGKNGVAVIDAQAKQVINTYPTGPGPQSLVLDLIDPSHLWVANSGGNTVTVLNPDSGKQIKTVTVGVHPVSIALATPTSGITETDASSEVLVANQDASSLTVLNSESFNVLATVPLPLGDNPIWVTVPAFGGTAYVTTKQGHVYGFALASHQFFGPIFRGQDLHGMDYDALTGEVYVPDSQANQVDVLRPVSSGQSAPTKFPSEPVRTLPVGGGPATVAITSDGSLGIVGQQSGNITFLEVPTHKVLGSIQVGGRPQFVLAGPFPPLVNRQSAQIILIIIYVVAGVLLVGGIVWLVWWIRKQERRIRQLRALDDAELERQQLAAQVIDTLKEQSIAEPRENGAHSLEAEAEQDAAAVQDGPPASSPLQRNSTSRPKPGPKTPRKRRT